MGAQFNYDRKLRQTAEMQAELVVAKPPMPDSKYELESIEKKAAEKSFWQILFVFLFSRILFIWSNHPSNNPNQENEIELNKHINSPNPDVIAELNSDGTEYDKPLESRLKHAEGNRTQAPQAISLPAHIQTMLTTLILKMKRYRREMGKELEYENDKLENAKNSILDQRKHQLVEINKQWGKDCSASPKFSTAPRLRFNETVEGKLFTLEDSDLDAQQKEKVKRRRADRNAQKASDAQNIASVGLFKGNPSRSAESEIPTSTLPIVSLTA